MAENAKKVMVEKNAKIEEFSKALEKSRTNMTKFWMERDELGDGNKNLEEDLKMKDVIILNMADEKKDVIDTLEAW